MTAAQYRNALGQMAFIPTAAADLARHLAADDILGRILQTADDCSRDHVQKTGPDGKRTWVEDRNHIANCQFRINALFRIIDLLAP